MTMRYYRNSGHERAIKHIQAYNELKRRLGPIVEDVKKIFFSLSKKEFDDLMERYGELYSPAAKQYAIKTYKSWKDGTRKMAGQTAERLIDLVPKYLSFDQRFRMVEKLCLYHAQKRYYNVILQTQNPNPAINEIKQRIKELSSLTNELKKLPDHVKKTISWLSDDDITVARKILNAVDKKLNNNSIKHASTELNKIITVVKNKDYNTYAIYKIKMTSGEIHIDIKPPKKTFWQRIFS